VGVYHRFGFDHVGIAQIEFDATEDGLQTAAAKLAAVQTFFDPAENSALLERVARIGVPVRHGRHASARLNCTPHGHRAARDEEQRPELAPGKVADAEIAKLQKDAKQENHHAPKPGVAADDFGNAHENQDHRPELEKV